MENKIEIRPNVLHEIDTFYYNMWQKYKHSWGEEEIIKLISDTYNDINKLSTIKVHRKSTKEEWYGLFMANIDKWYFAYRIEDDTIYVEDACHSQNMHEIVYKMINLVERMSNL